MRSPQVLSNPQMGTCWVSQIQRKKSKSYLPVILGPKEEIHRQACAEALCIVPTGRGQTQAVRTPARHFNSQGGRTTLTNPTEVRK